MTGAQRVNLQENVDLIRLQREIKDKSTKLTALQGKYMQLEEVMTFDTYPIQNMR